MPIFENGIKEHAKRNNKKSTKKVCRRKMWSKEETGAVIAYFDTYIKTNRSAPGKVMCQECLEQNKSVLNMRTWKDIKYFVYNYLTKINKISR